MSVVSVRPTRSSLSFAASADSVAPWLTLAGGSALVAGALLPWLSVYQGLDVFRGVDGLNGRVLLAAGILAAALGTLRMWRPDVLVRVAVGAVGVASAGFAAWVVAQLLGSYQALSADAFALPGLGAGAFVTLLGGLAVLVSSLLVDSPFGAARQGIASRVKGEVVLVAVASAFLVSAGLIHLSVIGPHLAESPLYVAFFIIAGGVQLLAAMIVATRPRGLVPLAVAVGSMVMIGVWAISRTTGLPFGPQPGVPEDISLPDVIATIVEALTALACGLLFAKVAIRSSVRRAQARAMQAGVWFCAIGLTVAAIIGVQAGGG